MSDIKKTPPTMMSEVDRQFSQVAREIIFHGWSDDEMWTRAKWPDGTPAHTTKIHNITCSYNLQQEFPLLSFRYVNLRKAVEEILWIFQKQSCNVHDFSLHIWDQWADETGSIGKSYGYQAGVEYEYPDGKMNQVNRLLKDLKEIPMSRRHIITLYNPHDLKDMHMAPCCCFLIFNVQPPKSKGGHMTLDMMLVQRSWDLLTAGGWDVAAHAALQMMIAQAVGMKPGTFTHVINNAHIYDRHVEYIEEILRRGPVSIPTVKLNPDVHDFYQFTPEDWEVSNYAANNFPEKFEVAI